jgi:hypothetical protein
LQVAPVARVGEAPACLYARRFSEFRVYPTVVSPGDTITVTGKLEWHFPVCVWSPAGGDEVVLVVDGVRVSKQGTAADGTFKFVLPASQLGLGRHVVYCEATEYWRGCYAKSAEVVVEVVTEEEKKQREWEEFLRSVAIWGTVGAVVVGAVALGLYIYERERRLEMLRLLLA